MGTRGRVRRRGQGPGRDPRFVDNAHRFADSVDEPGSPAERRMKIAVFCPNWVGDLVMATPALRGVRNRFPKAEIVGVMRPYVTDVVHGLDLFDWILPAASAVRPDFSSAV